MGKLRITYSKSAIGYSKTQKATVRSLGLRKLNSVVVHDDTPAIRGMIFAVRHLVRVEEIAGEQPAAAEPAPKKARAPRASTRTTAALGDDLKRIEGIGPKIAGVLQEAGIVTFAQLAATEVDRLTEILRDAGLRMADPGSWPEQAALAAAGSWDELEQLQARLTAGRSA